MNDEAKKMHVNLSDASLLIEWPADVSTESLMFIEELLTAQARSVRRTILQRKSEGQMQLQLVGALVREGSTDSKGGANG